MAGWRSPAPPIATSQPPTAPATRTAPTTAFRRWSPNRLRTYRETPGVATNNTDAILGIINPAGGAFPLLNRIGGDGNDGFHGMLELSGFLYVGGRTSSTNVDLESPDDGTFTPTFAANAGGTDGLLGRVPLGGGAWRATYFGGTGDEVINCLAPFLEGVFIFGTTASDDDSLPTSNVGIGTYFDATHNGGGTPLPLDMFFATFNNDARRFPVRHLHRWRAKRLPR